MSGSEPSSIAFALAQQISAIRESLRQIAEACSEWPPRVGRDREIVAAVTDAAVALDALEEALRDV